MAQGKWWFEPIPHNRSSRFPSVICIVDCETFPKETKKGQLHTLRIAAAKLLHLKAGEVVKESPYEVFREPDEFWQWLKGRIYRKQAIWVVSHNMAFDFGALDGYLYVTQDGWTPRFFAWSWDAWLGVLQKDHRTFKFVDSMALFRHSLSEVGKWVRIHKHPMPAWEDDSAAWEEYCVQDVTVLGTALRKYLEDVRHNDLGGFRMTLPSQAFTAWRHRFMEEEVVVHHVPRYQEMERRGYYGGRCEAYYIGEVSRSPLYYLDVQSMYGHILLTEPLPTRLVGYERRMNVRELASVLRRFEVLAEVELETQEPAYPYRLEGLWFPVGRFRTVLPGPELLHALSHGRVKKVHWALVYRRGKPFRAYAAYFLDRKRKAQTEGNLLSEALAKLYLNSIYGKFAQLVPLYEVRPNTAGEFPGMDVVYDPKTQRTSLRIVWGDSVFIQVGETPSRWSFVPIAAWVTSYGRLRLWELIRRVGEGHVYYCDTDGLIVDEEGLRRLRREIVPGEPGKLRVKREVQSLTIYGAKDYELDGERYIKGVPKEAREIRYGVWQYRTFLTGRQALRLGVISGVLERVTQRRRLSPYTKGEVHEDGRVTPRELEE